MIERNPCQTKGLIMHYSMYIKFYKINRNSKRLKLIFNNRGTIVVAWGEQTSGKSELLKKVTRSLLGC